MLIKRALNDTSHNVMISHNINFSDLKSKGSDGQILYNCEQMLKVLAEQSSQVALDSIPRTCSVKLVRNIFEPGIQTSVWLATLPQSHTLLLRRFVLTSSKKDLVYFGELGAPNRQWNHAIRRWARYIQCGTQCQWDKLDMGNNLLSSACQSI